MFVKYDRKGQAEMRPVTKGDIENSNMFDIPSEETPVLGDMIARDPKNPSDMWLVKEKYFKENFKKHSWA